MDLEFSLQPLLWSRDLSPLGHQVSSLEHGFQCGPLQVQQAGPGGGTGRGPAPSSLSLSVAIGPMSHCCCFDSAGD